MRALASLIIAVIATLFAGYPEPGSPQAPAPEAKDMALVGFSDLQGAKRVSAARTRAERRAGCSTSAITAERTGRPNP